MMASQIGEPMTADDLKYYFKKFDQNGDGFITGDELGLVMKTFGGKTYTKKEIDDMIAAVDKNADGKVNYEGTVRGLRLRKKSARVLRYFLRQKICCVLGTLPNMAIKCIFSFKAVE